MAATEQGNMGPLEYIEFLRAENQQLRSNAADHWVEIEALHARIRDQDVEIQKLNERIDRLTNALSHS